MKSIKFLGACALLGCVALSAAAAENAPRQKGSVAEACAQDVKTFCSEVKPGEGRIAACLKTNHEKVSAGCKDALKVKHRQHDAKRASNQPS